MSRGYKVYDEHEPIKHLIPDSNGDCKIQPRMGPHREQRSTVGPGHQQRNKNSEFR